MPAPALLGPRLRLDGNQSAALLARDATIGVISFRDALQIGRKRAIQILEACDRLGLTRRIVIAGRINKTSEKDHRILRNPDLFASGDV